MNSTALIVWNSFLHSAPPDQQSRLLHCISSELIQELQALGFSNLDLDRGFGPIEEELPKIHHSWLSPLLRALPENEIQLFLSALTPEQIKGLKHSLLFSNTLPTPSIIGQEYLKHTLFEMILETSPIAVSRRIADSEDLLPIACLPDDPLNAILDLSSTEILSLIDLLGMHDLSVEIRHIIETSKLKEIYSLLSKAQTTFLKTLLHKKEAVSFKKMGLLAWNGDREALHSMLLQRGLNRIAKSLYEHSPSLLWYIAHRLDVEKGQLLIKLCTALDHPKASILLGDQVIELIGAIKSHNPP